MKMKILQCHAIDYLNQCWLLAGLTLSMLREKSQWIFNQNTNILFQEHVICEIMASLNK